MSGANWEIHGGIRYPVDDGGGSVDRDGWTRFPTNPNIIRFSGQEYHVVKKITQSEAIAISLQKWSEKKMRDRAATKIQKYVRRMIVMKS
jgi:hypothetical protein